MEGGGGLMQLPMSFSELDNKPFGVSCWNFLWLIRHPMRNFWWKNLVRSGQVRSRSYDVTKGTTLGKISAKSWVNATWRDAIDLNGDSWYDWCQYMTSCDPWPCITWVSRSSKVTWGHWPRLTLQWPITNRHMLSGVSWGAESEYVVHCW